MISQIRTVFSLFFLLIIASSSFADEPTISVPTTSASASTASLTPEPPKAPQTLMANKPITIDANDQQIDIEKNTITFSGNVVIVQEGLTIKADKVVITDMQDSSKQKITGYGKPVNFKQVMPEKNKIITGHSNQIVYNVKQNNVTLIGNAQVFQQDNHIVSDIITYDVSKQQILAQPGKNGRVKTTIIPSQVKEMNK